MDEKASLKNRIIDRLIQRIDPVLNAPKTSIDLRTLPPKELEEAFIKFSEGDDGLYRLLKTAYEHGIDSMYSCKGHSTRDMGYVMFKVTDENLKMLQTMGKVLSHEGISTSFEFHHEQGPRVCFHSFRAKNRNWFNIATDTIINPPEEEIESAIYYNEKFIHSYVPLSFSIRDRVTKMLRKIRGERMLPKNTEMKTRNGYKEFVSKLNQNYPVESKGKIQDDIPNYIEEKDDEFQR